MKTQTNFNFLKNIDTNLYEIITEAEKLFQDEYFEQCMTQTRRFGEHVCKNVLGKGRTTEITFDEMLATLKDKISGEVQEKEFIEDLYFLKKQGNISTHSETVGINATNEMECIQRAFEVGISYAVYNKNSSPDLLNLEFDSELLITGKKSKKSLKDKYNEAKAKQEKTKNKTAKNNTTKSKTKQVSSMKSVPRKTGISPFWIFTGITFIITLCVIIFLVL